MWENYPIEIYTPEQIQEAVLILHPKIIERYEITHEEFHSVFTQGSNFSHLKYPIEDEYWNMYEDSEGYYMAQRFDSLKIKQAIAAASRIKWLSKKVAYQYREHMNVNDGDRIEFMRNSIQKKFDNSAWRRKILEDTWTRNIIEFTYWNDQFFWISHDTRTGRNILWKVLMEYRDS